MTALRLILGDQLTETLPLITQADKDGDVFLLCEVMEEATYVPHHKKKIAFLFTAMRHFAQKLENAGFKVRYVKLDDPDNTGSLDAEVRRAVADYSSQRIIVTAPGEWRVFEKFRSWKKQFDLPVDILDDTRFFCTVRDFKRWASEHNDLRMEYFYREMRRRHDILIEHGKPAGGQWNFDKDNRKPPLKDMRFPKRLSFKKDAITRDVLKLVENTFSHHPGELYPFHFAVTREQALQEAHHFIENGLPEFGTYQDAMVHNEAFLYHSLLSAYLNAGLLVPEELCAMAQAAWREGHVPLASAEGYIRQILGWREYIRGMYWINMPEYGKLNELNAEKSLPDFYWTGETPMRCLADTINQTMANAYSHHIQRLMITGNFALLAGLNPDEVCEWYLVVYADAYEWVELPNTRGMALFADGGKLASKPYAASGNYINKMSNFCKDCQYDPKLTQGENACPFNALYWDFLARHAERLRPNRRLSFAYAGWDRMDEPRQHAIRAQAAHFLTSPLMKSGSYLISDKK